MPLFKDEVDEKGFIKTLTRSVVTSDNENDVVMDFCMCSGTTGEACLKTNRKFIGIEKDEFSLMSLILN